MIHERWREGHGKLFVTSRDDHTFDYLGSSGNWGGSGINDLGGLVRLLSFLLLWFVRSRRSGFCSRVLEGSDWGGLIDLGWGLVNLSGRVDLLGLRLEEVTNTGRQTTSNLGRRPGGPGLLLFLLLLILLDLLRGCLRDRGIGLLGGSGTLSLLD